MTVPDLSKSPISLHCERRMRAPLTLPGWKFVQGRWSMALLAALMARSLVAGVPQNATRDAQAAAPRSTQQQPAAPVDINHATMRELMQVPGMTQSWAARIVRFRPYRTKQDLLDKGVVTSQVYDRIKDFVIAHRDKQ